MAAMIGVDSCQSRALTATGDKILEEEGLLDGGQYNDFGVSACLAWAIVMDPVQKRHSQPRYYHQVVKSYYTDF